MTDAQERALTEVYGVKFDITKVEQSDLLEYIEERQN